MLTTQASAGCAEGDEVMPCNSRPPLTLLLLYSCFVKNDVINKRPQVPALWKARSTCAKPPIFSIVIAIFVLHHSLIICCWLTNLPSLNQNSRLQRLLEQMLQSTAVTVLLPSPSLGVCPGTLWACDGPELHGTPEGIQAGFISIQSLKICF